MTLACARCGFPNPEDAVRCRACSAPLQDTSSDAAIKPKLRQIIAETRLNPGASATRRARSTRTESTSCRVFPAESSPAIRR